MKKFILLYNGPATSPGEMDEEKRKSIMLAWKQWMDSVGESLIDVGHPMANGAAVADNGEEKSASLLSGYSIIQAENLTAAKELVNSHPFLSDNDGKFSVEIHELMPVPM